MLFSVIISVTIVFICFMIDINLSSVSLGLESAFGAKIVTEQAIVENASQLTLAQYCP